MVTEQLDKDPVTVSLWRSNTIQPDLHTIDKITELLNVDRLEFLNNG